MTIKRTVGLVGLAAVFAASIAVAQEQDKKPKGHGGKKGQGWEVFVTAFDANKDGKVSKDELLAKQPGFDAVDKNGDKLVTSDEIEAARAGKKNPKQGGWLQRSEEHTSELQSLRHLVCRLLLEKKKNRNVVMWMT